jgi:hypothetical protein
MDSGFQASISFRMPMHWRLGPGQIQGSPLWP